MTVNQPFSPRVHHFLRQNLWHEADAFPVAAGASTRHFTRLVKPDGARVILMDTGGEERSIPASAYEQTIMPDFVPFVRIAGLLDTLGFSAPRIIARSEDDHALLVEDFGERELIRLLEQGADPAPLFDLAVDVLVALHKVFGETKPDMTGLRFYSPDYFLSHLAVIPEVYVPLMCGSPLPDEACRSFREIWHGLLVRACATPTSLMLRDFAISNAFYLPERHGVQAMGLIDFETAGEGPALYDLSAMVRNNRFPIPPAIVHRAKNRFLSAFPDMIPAEFDAAEHIFAAMRQVQWAGSCALYTRQGREGFLKNIPGIWGLIEDILLHPALSDAKNWFDRFIPRAARGESPMASNVAGDMAGEVSKTSKGFRINGEDGSFHGA